MSKKAKLKANWSDPGTTAGNEVLPKYLKWAWTSRGMSLAVQAILIMQLTYYSTDILGMEAVLVGTILLASKIFDGVTDLFIGFVIDRTHTKYGKARPYEIFVVFSWLLTILLFSTPDIGTRGKSVFIFVLYTLIFSICNTFLGGTDAVYLSRSIRNAQNRVSVMSFNGGIIMVFSIILSMLMPQLISGLGSTNTGWTIIAASLGIPMAIIGMFRFIFVKEVVMDNKEEQKTIQNVSMKTGISLVAKNKYIWIIAGMSLVVQATTNIGSAVNIYYFKYIMGDIRLATLVSISGVLTPFIMMLFPVLSRKIGTVNILRGGAILGTIGYGIRIIGGTNIVTIVVGSLLGSMGIIPITMMISIYVIDCMDYGEWKTGTRVEGMLNSVNSFFSKVGSGVASALVGLIMGLAGYNGALQVQSASANRAIVVLFNYLPMALMAVLLVLALLYKLDRKLPAIRAELEAKNEAKHA